MEHYRIIVNVLCIGLIITAELALDLLKDARQILRIYLFLGYLEHGWKGSSTYLSAEVFVKSIGIKISDIFRRHCHKGAELGTTHRLGEDGEVVEELAHRL
ncbi:Uncharacterised protein [Chlamydia trachomatis]|nr:Uncharacterised protein [Chlamydia trachomatis]